MASTTDFDLRQFRNVLGHFATGVTVITAKDVDQGYVGTTASSFNSVSLDPPLILWSIDKSTRSLKAYEQAEHFAVNILAADQLAISNHFAGQMDDKFAGVDYRLSDFGIPLLPGCVATFDCKTAYVYEGGDHYIIVGEVLNFASDDERKALLFHRGAYALAEPHLGE